MRTANENRPLLRSKIRVLVRLSVLFCAVGDPIQADAQAAVQLNAYRAAELPSDGFAVSRPTDLDHLRFATQLSTDYSKASLVVGVPSASGTKDVYVVAHQLTLNLGLAFGFFDRFVLFGGIPVNAVMQGERAPGLPSADGALVSDPWFGGRVRLFGDAAAPFALGAQLTGTLPLADAVRASQRYSGEIGGTLLPEVLGELRFARGIHCTFNLGTRIRPQDKAQVVRDLPISHELTWGSSLSVPVLTGREPGNEGGLVAHAELYGRHTLADLTNDALGNVEVLVGARAQPYTGLLAGAAVGTSLLHGYGAPEVRAVLNLGFATGRPRDTTRAPMAVAVTNPSSEAAPQPATLPVDASPPSSIPATEVPEPAAAAQRAQPSDTLAESSQANLAPASEVPAPVAVLDQHVAFAAGHYETDGSMEQALKGVLDVLASHPEVEHVQVEGHTDSLGAADPNMVLSLRRAQSVQAWLVAHGVEATRLETVGCGESRPISDQAGEQNRRVEFRIVAVGAAPREGCHP